MNIIIQMRSQGVYDWLSLIGIVALFFRAVHIRLPNSVQALFMPTTKLSAKGQITLPKSLWDSGRWPVGTEYAIEKIGDGLLLRPVKVFAPTRPEDVFGCLHRPGEARTIEEMDQAIDDEVKRRHDCGRY